MNASSFSVKTTTLQTGLSTTSEVRNQRGVANSRTMMALCLPPAQSLNRFAVNQKKKLQLQQIPGSCSDLPSTWMSAIY